MQNQTKNKQVNKKLTGKKVQGSEEENVEIARKENIDKWVLEEERQDVRGREERKSWKEERKTGVE